MKTITTSSFDKPPFNEKDGNFVTTLVQKETDIQMIKQNLIQIST
jgi:hypothetical protein